MSWKPGWALPVILKEQSRSFPSLMAWARLGLRWQTCWSGTEPRTALLLRALLKWTMSLPRLSTTGGPTGRPGWGRPGHVRLCSDVWDLVREPTILRAFLTRVPREALLLLVGGSPCQQLTRMGRYQGAQGLCGPTSVHFYIVPVLAALI